MSNRSQLADYIPGRETVLALCQFQSKLARQHTFHTVPGLEAVSTSLLREKFANQQRQFVLTDGQNEWLAHVVARVSPTVQDGFGKPVGMLGFFESLKDEAAAHRVLDAAVAWLRKQGCRSIVGPMDGDTWHAYRFSIGPFRQPPFLGELSNPAHYPHYWKTAGFEIAASYHSRVVDDIESVLPSVKTQFLRAKSNGIHFRHLEMARFEDELELLHRISICSFQSNFLYDEISLVDFKRLYRKARSLIDPELVWFATDSQGREIGFLFCIVDFGQAVAAMRGKENLWAKLKFALKKNRATAVNFKSIAVLPEHRRSAVASALMFKGYQTSLARGFHRANLCLIRDGNPSSRLDGGQSQISRRYELYQAPGNQLES